jgi:DNA-binding MarR family transcriptional regulator
VAALTPRQLNLEDINGLDEVLHAKARLGIMTILASGSADFTTLRKRLQLSGGNLGAHLRVLEDMGYLEIEKKFVGRRPKTIYKVTSAGRKAFRSYLNELESVIRLANR